MGDERVVPHVLPDVQRRTPMFCDDVCRRLLLGLLVNDEISNRANQWYVGGQLSGCYGKVLQDATYVLQGYSQLTAAIHRFVTEITEVKNDLRHFQSNTVVLVSEL